MNTSRTLTSRPRFQLTALIIAISCFVACPREGLSISVRPLVVTAIVKEIHLDTRTVTLQVAGKSTMLVVMWDNHTVFLLNGMHTEPATLSVNIRVEVSYHAPLFGKKFATRFRWSEPSRPSTLRRGYRTNIFPS